MYDHGVNPLSTMTHTSPEAGAGGRHKSANNEPRKCDSESTATTETRDGDNGKGLSQPNPTPAWAFWLLPSIADFIFLALIGTVVFRPIGSGLLGDADTGWHIRNGQRILATHLITRSDPFSYTKAGQPWFAWEWLYDVIIAAIHQAAGLNGVLLFTLMLTCGTLALLFQLLLKRSGNLVVAGCLTLFAAGASQVHLLARPHVVSWLLCLLWLEILYRFNEGKTGRWTTGPLLWLPLLMVVWVNVHGGFILGLVMIGIFGCGLLWRYFIAWNPEDLTKIQQLAAVLVLCLAATLLTPYGYQLHIHVYQYLSSDFLMNSINEFSSPNFHVSGDRYFEVFVMIAVAACALGWKRLTAIDILLVLFALHSALFAGRNIPIAAILISMALCRMLSTAISPAFGQESRPRLVSVVLERLDAISSGMTAMEGRFRGHLVVLALMAGSWAVALHGGTLLGNKVMASTFDDSKFPVRATGFLAAKGVHDHLFTIDSWSGYLIYQLYPDVRLFFDDRHDFYGESFVREYLKAVSGDTHWKEPLDKYKVNWVLVPANLPLTSLLRESSDWQVEYSDSVAIVFHRRESTGQH